jgi:hypothetical protein
LTEGVLWASMKTKLPKIYHIVHIDRLPSIIEEGYLWCDAKVVSGELPGTSIGMDDIKKRRLEELTLNSYPDLHVGDCVPFYFCPRSVMLYVIYKSNHTKLRYHGGQEPIVHLEVDLNTAIDWAGRNGIRWAFTLSNAGARYSDDYSDVASLNKINWKAVHANHWSGDGVSPAIKEGKQAEFLIEKRFPWNLVERIGVISDGIYRRVTRFLSTGEHRPIVKTKREWYYE